MALNGYREVPRDMQEVAREIRDAFDVLYDKLMKAVGQTMESIERAQKDRALVKEAIATTEAAIETLQAQADAPAPEGQQKPPPPKDLSRAKRNVVRLKAIKKEIDSTIKQLETQLYQLKLERDYLAQAYGRFNNTYHFQLTTVNSVVWSASTAAGHARNAIHTLRASSSSHMECDSPSYLKQAAESVDAYSRRMEQSTSGLTRSTARYAEEMSDNVSRNATKAATSLRRDMLRQVEQTRSHAGRLRQAASYLDLYLGQAR